MMALTKASSGDKDRKLYYHLGMVTAEEEEEEVGLATDDDFEPELDLRGHFNPLASADEEGQPLSLADELAMAVREEAKQDSSSKQPTVIVNHLCQEEEEEEKQQVVIRVEPKNAEKRPPPPPDWGSSRSTDKQQPQQRRLLIHKVAAGSGLGHTTEVAGLACGQSCCVVS